MSTTGPGRPRHDDVLTPAEWRVAEWVRHRLTNRRIAERMGVSTDAVKFHVANALSKLKKWLAAFEDYEGRPLQLITQVRSAVR